MTELSSKWLWLRLLAGAHIAPSAFPRKFEEEDAE
jgi:hypothetical protein